MIPASTLLVTFAGLSLLAFGGGNTILPEMQRQLVSVHHWMSAAEFSALYGLAQAAPGPNMMVVTLLGWRMAGLAGALAATAGTFVPSFVLTVVVLRVWDRFRDARWRLLVQRGLAPVTAGLVGASAWLIAHATATSALLTAVMAGVAVLSCTTRLHPLWLLAAAAVVGVAG